MLDDRKMIAFQLDRIVYQNMDDSHWIYDKDELTHSRVVY